MTKRKLTKNGAIIALAAICLLTAAAVYAAGGGEGHGGGPSSAKLWDLLYRTLNFAGLALILFFALRKPITNGLNGRRESIRAFFEDLENKKGEAEALYRDHEKKLARIDDEVKKIVDAAVKQGEAEKKRIIVDAQRAANDIRRQAEMAVQHELAEAKKHLREEIAELTSVMAEELIRKNLRPSDHINLVDNYLEKVGGLK